jgi:hypothetical protein
MPYQESSLADRLKQYPEDHRGYATPGVKYGKSGNIQLPHRPTVVSERDLDKRLGMVNGQPKGDKTPFRDNLVSGGLSKKYTPRHVSQQNSIKEKMNRRHAESVTNKETHSTVETAMESGNLLMELSIRHGSYQEFNRFKSARASVKGIPFKQKPRKVPKKIRDSAVDPDAEFLKKHAKGMGKPDSTTDRFLKRHLIERRKALGL